ncbi:MAG: hypothetical protein ACREMK_04995 [Gemmatimonadota bacterium]
MDREEHKQLTDEVVAPASWREILVTVAGVLTIALLVNFAFVLAPTTNTGYLVLRQKWHMLNELREEVDLLVLGDSSCRQALEPQLAATRLGLTSGLNLCTTGNALVVNDAWMLESYLARFRPPKAVLVIHSFDILRRELSFPTLAQIPLEWGYWRRFTPRLDPGTAELVQFFVARYLPLYASNLTLGQLFSRPFRTIQHYLEFRHRMGEHGFVTEERAYPNGVRNDMRRHVQFMSQNAFRVSEVNRAALERIRVLADRYDFDVYLIHGPVYEELLESGAFQRYVGDMGEYLESQALGSENVYYLPDLVTFAADQMQNVDHVIEPAARRYTLVVASRIADDFRPLSGGGALPGVEGR